jgi:hypothetical protein
VIIIASNLAYKSRGVRALVLLHDEHMRRFFQTWQRARACSVILPSTEDPSYLSLDTLMRHVLDASRGYIVWICEMLQLLDPGIRPVPDALAMSREAESYMEHILECWRAPLQNVRDEQLDTPEFRSRWNTLYSIDAMLEHAVMHPIRHAFQLEELMHGN